VKENVMMSWNQ